jgi:hypothetical protein
MNIKILGRKGGIEVTNGDLIMSNGASYILVTKQIWSGYSKVHPVVSKAQFNKLMKSGNIVKSPKMYKAMLTDDLYPMYEIRESEKITEGK